MQFDMSVLLQKKIYTEDICSFKFSLTLGHVFDGAGYQCGSSSDRELLIRHSLHIFPEHSFSFCGRSIPRYCCISTRY